jgi:hypothetical protein
VLFRSTSIPTSAVPTVIITSIIPTTTVTQVSIPTYDLKQSPITNKYPYVFDGDYQSISFTSYGGVVNSLQKTTPFYYADPYNETFILLLKNDKQDLYLKPLIEDIKKRSSNPDTQAKIAISLVQSIPIRSSDNTIDPYYPYETLYYNLGTTTDKSLLLSYLLNELGYDTILFSFPYLYVAVGIKSTSPGNYGTEYAYIDTTRRTIITYSSDILESGSKLPSNPEIIHLKGGTQVLNTNSEYSDAWTFKQIYTRILIPGTNYVSDTDFREWKRINNKYGLKWATNLPSNIS